MKANVLKGTRKDMIKQKRKTTKKKFIKQNFQEKK